MFHNFKIRAVKEAGSGNARVVWLQAIKPSLTVSVFGGIPWKDLEPLSETQKRTKPN